MASSAFNNSGNLEGANKTGDLWMSLDEALRRREQAKAQLSGKIGPDTDDVQRIKAEYLEMPSLRLTARQAQRLFGLDPANCEHILDTLVENKFLSRTRDRMYVRFDFHDLRATNLSRPPGQR